jgi:hypothetical protein
MENPQKRRNAQPSTDCLLPFDRIMSFFSLMGNFFTYKVLRFITTLVTTAALLGSFGCDARPYPTQPSSENAPAAKWASTPHGVFVASHQGQEVFRIEATKWRDGHRAAVAITHDAPWGIDPVFSLATNAVIARGLHMDIEVVSDKLQHPSRFPIVARMHRELLPNGVHVYGHGHTHIDHDAISYHDAFRSFRTNFDLMRAWGFKPKVYAYPLYAGRDRQTQAANRAAGFIAARGGTRDRNAYYICANDAREPESWYNLPSVIMGTDSPSDISSHDQLQPFLIQTLAQQAWIIMTYHSIGYPEGWGYYPYREFVRNLDFIRNNDFWSGNLDAIAAYVQERNALDISIARYFGRQMPDQFELKIGDGLDNQIFDEPLTLDFHFADELAVQGVRITPAPTGDQTHFVVSQNRLRLHMVPDERQYTLVLEH